MPTQGLRSWFARVAGRRCCTGRRQSPGPSPSRPSTSARPARRLACAGWRCCPAAATRTLQLPAPMTICAFGRGRR
eukprot:3851252-Prymnesium_polylepis.1